MENPISIIVFLIMLIFYVKAYGWKHLWYIFFVMIMLTVLLLGQKHLGKIEGALLAFIPVITIQLIIKYSQKANKLHSKILNKFVNWCNKNIYDLSKKS